MLTAVKPKSQTHLDFT